MRFILSVIAVLLAASCTSRSLEKDYKVVDASHQDIPEWVSDLEEWLDDEADKKSKYYYYMTEAKNSRAISCEIAKARSMTLVAEEISTFIKQSFAQTTEGNPLEVDEKLSEYVEDRLFKEVKATIVGAKTEKTYWEKRRFQKELGAKKDYDGFVCASLTSISKKNLEKAFKQVETKLVKKAKNTSKEKVKKILEEATNKI